jgi:PAS domain S-box-containing protein
MIYVDNHAIFGRFTPVDLDLLAAFANQAAAALENAELYTGLEQRVAERTVELQSANQELKQRFAELAVINAVQQGLSTQLEFQGIVELVGDKLREVFNFPNLDIRLYDPKTDLVSYPYMFEHGKRIYVEPLKLKGISRHVIQNRRPLIINQEMEKMMAETGSEVLPGTDMPRSLVAIPILSGDEVFGLIYMDDSERENAFDQADVRLLTTLASSMSVALQNARLFEQIQQRATEMAALSEIGREISATLDLATVLERISSNAGEVLEADLSAVFLLEPDGQTLRAITAVGNEADAILEDLIHVGEGIIGGIAASGVAERIPDTTHDPRSLQIPGTGETPEGEQLMVAPLFTRDKVVGVMAVWREQHGIQFTESDLEFLIGLARQAAIAIQNARLYEEVQHQKQYSEALVRNSPVAIITTDLETRVVSWNPAAEQLFGYTAAEAIGQCVDELVSTPESRKEAEEYTRQALTAGGLELITRRTRKDGSPVDVELLGLPILVDGQSIGMLAIYHDITELLRARREAESANQAKSAFLATMSHEIRTPMNGVIGMASLLLSTELSDEQHEYAEIIRSSGDALLSIINDILDFSKIEAGKMELELQPFDVREAIEKALDLVAARAVEKGLELSFVVEQNVPATLVGDSTRLRQILLNVLSNAVKFTEHGEVVLTVSGDSDGPAPTSGWNTLQFAVRDTGIGIPLDRQNRLFQSFSQVDASTSRKYGGTGLGLAISLRLCEMMGGKMWVESSGIPGEGATVYFTIRAEALASPVATRPVLHGLQSQLAGKRALIVDDNDTNRRILVLQLRNWGLATRDTASPQVALDWVQRGDPFDLAILDMQMPEMDGITLAGQLRKFCTPEQLPLILCSSLGRKEAGADALGFAANLTKPVKPSQLLDTLAGLFDEQAVPQREDKSRTGSIDREFARRYPLRILLAEDNAVNQKLALRILQQMGYQADVANNGLEVLQSLERQPYDLILMDVQMPEMDGLEATRQIVRRWTRSTRPWIVAMTANAMQGDREMCLQAGMDDYIAKPIRIEELVEALSKTRPLKEEEK